ncbi:molybdopterin converting factor subunit 1 [Stappia sp. ES.058]|uniref:molybdopterin converting factor subunit 1 n=1 Tax=Stappia sp. ES.058 TaxID=1881061 RepID=UPI000879E647|nr:molybdopterin converting factor subunit 1 [Stappia sp. ES.058]SDU29026.1 molybdopterin synthase subunit MoaD [Stappia sp. ES.058]
MQLRYFAWVRERVGRDAETIKVPDGVATVGALIDWLSARDESYADAFAERDAIRVALDHEHVDHAAPLNGAREAAFFPPMTGG